MFTEQRVFLQNAAVEEPEQNLGVGGHEQGQRSGVSPPGLVGALAHVRPLGGLPVHDHLDVGVWFQQAVRRAAKIRAVQGQREL